MTVPGTMLSESRPVKVTVEVEPSGNSSQGPTTAPDVTMSEVAGTPAVTVGLPMSINPAGSASDSTAPKASAIEVPACWSTSVNVTRSSASPLTGDAALVTVNAGSTMVTFGAAPVTTVVPAVHTTVLLRPWPATLAAALRTTARYVRVMRSLRPSVGGCR